MREPIECKEVLGQGNLYKGALSNLKSYREIFNHHHYFKR